MLKPEKMVKISVVGSREKIEEVASLLHRMNLVHIEEPEESEYFRIGEPLESASYVSRALVQMRSFISHLKLDPSKIVPKRKYKASEIEAQLKQKLEEYQRLIGEKLEYLRSVDEKVSSLKEELNNIEPLKQLGIPARLLKRYKTLRVFVGMVKENPESKLSEITSEFEMFAKEYGKELVVAVFVKAEYGDEFLRILQESGFRELPVPDVDDFDARIAEIEKEIESLQSKKEQIEKEIEEIKVKEAETILAIEEFLSIQMDKYELPLKTLVSRYSFVLVGYIPAKSLDTFKAQMDSNGVAVEVLEEEGEPPTKLNNPVGVRNFELLTTTFGVPKYKEIDPTLFIAIFFPIFFGMMLGDIGYGLLVTILSLYLKRVFKTEGWQRMLNIGVYAGVMSIVFGVIYGECFGPFVVPGEYEPYQIHFIGSQLEHFYEFHHGHPIFDRVEEMGVKILLFATIIIGIAKILFGFALGFYNVYVEHGLKDAILEKLSWIIGVTGLAMIIFGFAYNVGVFYQLGLGPDPGDVPPLPLPGLMEGWQAGVNMFYVASLPLLVIWFILFVMGEVPKMGAMGVILAVELLTWFGQIMSYARLLAIGLSSVYIAFVVNFIGMKIIDPVGISIPILGALILVVGHIGNLILGILDPGLQSLRLHYVEFFTKFFEGGGKLYEPFGRIKRFIEE